MVSVFPKQTVVKRGSLVFCVSKNSETSPHSGREGETLTALPVEGTTQAPEIWAAAEHERRSPLQRMSVFAGNCPTPMDILMENLGWKNNQERSSIPALVILGKNFEEFLVIYYGR
jgi:hypothetical protein